MAYINSGAGPIFSWQSLDNSKQQLKENYRSKVRFYLEKLREKLLVIMKDFLADKKVGCARKNKNILSV